MQTAHEPLVMLLIQPPGYIIPSGESTLEFRFGTFCVPNGNPMPPPELPADAPIALFGKPIDIRLGISLRKKLHPAVFDGVDGHLSQTRLAVAILHQHKP